MRTVKSKRFHVFLSGLLFSATLAGCVSDGAVRLNADEPISFQQAAQLIDELDRRMTARGTIGVKSPDVWGQDRLARFRSEYEREMARQLGEGFNSDNNAAIRRYEAESQRLQVAATVSDHPFSPTPTTPAPAAATPPAAAETKPGAKGGIVLEPTVVLDERSHYLNHLNQLRRINAGDDLTDRPGYGLYLVRMPVTLSPGPESRIGKGAIITVSAKSHMNKDMLRITLRNVVINETLNNLNQVIAAQTRKEGRPRTSRGGDGFSLIAYADTEVIYGPTNIAFLLEEVEREIGDELKAEPHHRDARVAEWLKRELTASYSFVEEASTDQHSSHGGPTPLDQIGELVTHRRYEELAKLCGNDPSATAVVRAGYESGGAMARRRKVVELLGFALRIQAAAVNKSLKDEILSYYPTIELDYVKNINFFDSNPSDDALNLFQGYVQAKWPLRVFSIEPVIAQQNVADTYSGRGGISLSLAGSGPAGPVKLSAGVSNDRRTEVDEAAIRLNPTMVGFGAGKSTFGWIFYPQIQTTRPRKDNLYTSVARTVFTGRSPDPAARELRIEPGQRECTALVVMSNFTPAIEFTTVANWFDTTDNLDGQKAEIEKASILASSIVQAEGALLRIRDDKRQYSGRDMRIALERVEQLKDFMPTQRFNSPVPFCGEGNDARIFTSQGGQLRPTVTGWHGMPPEEGISSTIFLEGNNFTIHDTRVLIGNEPAEALLVSKTLLQVTISKEARPSASGGGPRFFDVNVATPHGVSNHMLIETRPGDPSRLKEHEKPPPPSKPEVLHELIKIKEEQRTASDLKAH
jgi:hypothetical protein